MLLEWLVIEEYVILIQDLYEPIYIRLFPRHVEAISVTQSLHELCSDLLGCTATENLAIAHLLGQGQEHGLISL